MRTKKRLGEMLIESKVLTEEKLKDALVEQKKARLKLGQFLTRHDVIKDDQLVDVLCQQLKLEKYNEEEFPLDEGLVEIIPFDVSQRYQVLPLKKKGRLLTIAMVDPLDIGAMDAIEVLTDSEVEPVVCTEAELNHMVSTLYGAESGISSVLDGVGSDTEEEGGIEVVEEDDEDVKVESLQEMAGEATIVRLVNSIFDQAIRDGASDIHVCPQQNSVQLRFRIDGRLHEMQAPPKNMFLPLVARVKLLSNMDITLSRMPQDGRFTLKMNEKEINVRASVLPTIYGENLVLRLLDVSSHIYSLDRLGMSSEVQDKMKAMFYKPYGMIISTGPSGSGKSSSLYAILNEINKPEINIITLEDPVEYRINNIRQVQLHTKAGMTFASGLKSILRQDPDVIMVGEIRDKETASIAVEAAQTGHRVLSTLHTNDAAGAFTRFIDMGIEPFLVSSVLLVTFAQRLVRTICEYCKEPYKPSESALIAWGLEDIEGADFQHGKGCPRCLNSGFKGRTGIYEVLINDEMIQDMVLNNRSSAEISREAIKAGKLKTLKDDAVDKVVKGITTLEEASLAVMS